MKLTRSFALEDFQVSSSRPSLTLPIPAEYHPRVRSLALLLQELQDWVDATYGPSRYRLSITSGYRPPELNKAVGGASSSLHVSANAVDFIVLDSQGRTAPELLPLLWAQISRTMVGRIGEAELTTKHIHISNRTAGQADDFMVLLKEPMKVFSRPPTDEEIAVVVAAVGAVLAFRAL